VCHFFIAKDYHSTPALFRGEEAGSWTSPTWSMAKSSMREGLQLFLYPPPTWFLLYLPDLRLLLLLLLQLSDL
jgi:hypothetical protein